MYFNNKVKLLCTLTTALAVFFFLMQPTVKLAAASDSNDIRVSLFLSSFGTVPAVTLHAVDMKLSELAADESEVKWKSWQGNQSIRVSLDQYKVKVLQTSDLAKALDLNNKLQAQGETAYIVERPSSEGTRYMVYAAPSLSKQEVSQAMNRINQYSFTNNVEMAGPFYVNAGTYTTESEAWERISKLSPSAGAAVVALQRDKQGAVTYSVWVGAVADQSELPTIISVVSEGETANTDLPYMLLMKEISSATTSQRIDRVEINPDQRLLVANEGGEITVTERYNRSYRGKIEITAFENKLAVVNQLPLEHYLYGVVGAEMGTNWPLEALKAQAVAARTFALSKLNGNSFVDLSDTNYDQVYKGTSVESTNVIKAVDATEGEVLKDSEGNLIQALYFSNAGGMTAIGTEVWGTDVSYLQNVPSLDDGAEQGKLLWNRVVLPDGSLGYVRSDFTDETGAVTSGGLEILKVNGTNVNVRKAPYVDNINNAPIAQVNIGDLLVQIDQTLESNAYRWIRGPFSSEQLIEWIQDATSAVISGDLKVLEVTERGPSGRVIAMEANGKSIDVRNPDAYRSVFGSLPSTRFDVEQTAHFEVLGEKGNVLSVRGDGETLHALTGSGTTVELKDEMLTINNNDEVRYLTSYPSFRFTGYGYGHGLGMSQWGAKGLAEFMGYDYKQILSYYYAGVKLSKE